MRSEHGISIIDFWPIFPSNHTCMDDMEHIFWSFNFDIFRPYMTTIGKYQKRIYHFFGTWISLTHSHYLVGGVVDIHIHIPVCMTYRRGKVRIGYFTHFNIDWVHQFWSIFRPFSTFGSSLSMSDMFGEVRTRYFDHRFVSICIYFWPIFRLDMDAWMHGCMDGMEHIRVEVLILTFFDSSYDTHMGSLWIFEHENMVWQSISVRSVGREGGREGVTEDQGGSTL
jgi:hypothetical protein